MGFLGWLLLQRKFDYCMIVWGEGCGNAFLICTQQCRKLCLMHLFLEDTLRLSELLFYCIEVCYVCPGS